MTPVIEVPLRSGVHVVKLPRKRLAFVLVEALGQKTSRQVVERAAEMIGLQVVEKEKS
jgi:hypothetical protein